MSTDTAFHLYLVVTLFFVIYGIIYNNCASIFVTSDLSNKLALESYTLQEYLSQYNRSTLIKFIRSIEKSIYFEKINIINKSEEINTIFWSDKSPHYYDGPIDLSPGKTCKVIRGMYTCTPYAAINKGHMNEWTLVINETYLDEQTVSFLHTLQKQYNFYTNVHKKLISNLKTYSSPFMKPANIYFFGNSHMKELIQSISCLMDDIEINIFNNSYDTSIQSFFPEITRLNASQPYIYDYNNTLCGEWQIKKWYRAIEENGLGPESISNEILKQHRNDKNILYCTTKKLHAIFGDNSNLYYHANHLQRRKRIYKMFDENIRHIESNINMNKLEIQKAIDILNDGLDIIVFNIGNTPFYNWEKLLQRELKALNHSNKFVLFLSEWWDRIESTKQLMHNEKYLKEFERKYPNIIWIDLYKRNTLKFLHWRNNTGFGGHRWVTCESDKETPRCNHLCLPGAPDHHTLELIELINLLQQTN